MTSDTYGLALRNSFKQTKKKKQFIKYINFKYDDLSSHFKSLLHYQKLKNIKQDYYRNQEGSKPEPSRIN